MDIQGSLPSEPPKRPKKPFQGQIVVPGEAIATDEDVMRGHGTFIEDGILYSSVAGYVERINKLVSVRPFKSRYNGETGDVVIGRIVSVGQNRWKVDINAKQNAVLLIGSINLHGGVHRRRTIEDTHEMRTYFVENDIIVADVHQAFQDGSVSLQVPRNVGKLENGCFCAVIPSLIKRSSSHFITLKCNVDIILGVNGYIWITQTLSEEEQEKKEAQGSDYKPPPIDLETRKRMVRVRNSILALSRNFLPIHPDTIIDVYKQSLKYEEKDMLKKDVIDIITKSVQMKI